MKDGRAGRTALTYVCMNTLSDVALEILKRDNVKVNVKDCTGNAALIVASVHGLSEVVLEILKQDNVDMNVQRYD